MHFSVNKEVVKVIELLVLHPSLQILLIITLLVIRLPELIRALKGTRK